MFDKASAAIIEYAAINAAAAAALGAIVAIMERRVRNARAALHWGIAATCFWPLLSSVQYERESLWQVAFASAAQISFWAILYYIALKKGSIPETLPFRTWMMIIALLIVGRRFTTLHKRWFEYQRGELTSVAIETSSSVAESAGHPN